MRLKKTEIMDKKKKIQAVRQLIVPETIYPPTIDDIIIVDDTGTPVLSMKKRRRLSPDEIQQLLQKKNS